MCTIGLDARKFSCAKISTFTVLIIIVYHQTRKNVYVRFVTNNKNRKKVFNLNKREKVYAPVVVHDGVEAMSDGEYRGVRELGPDRGLDEVVRHHVHGGRRLV